MQQYLSEEDRMLRNVALVGLLVMVLGLNGCMVVASPAIGVLYTEVKYGDTATTSSGNKEGKACAQSILGLVATGDASIAAAKQAGGISEVSMVDHTAKNIVGILGEWCTVVKGR
jgi:TRL (tRNA-associated locus)-like protein